jgi:hypothetical protein
MTIGKPVAATAVIELLMMGMRIPETCWAVSKRQVNKLEKLLHLVGWFIWIPSFYLSSLSIACFRRQFPRKMWPIQSAFPLFTVCRTFLSSLPLCNSSFLTRSVQLISILLQHISKLSRRFWQSVNQSRYSAPLIQGHYFIRQVKVVISCRHINATWPNARKRGEKWQKTVVG